MKKNYVVPVFFSLITLYLFDLGNPDALRQGTEGFYLLISKEMYEAGSYLTPIIYGEHHWSKPPLHFWFPMPFIKLFFNDYLFAARFSIAILSLVLIGLISLWYQRVAKRNWWEVFIFLVCPVYFFKYSRIFMMEMPLALLSTLAALYFYDYINKASVKNLTYAAIFTALSSLIKGPVSLFLIFPASFIYTVVKKKSLKDLFIFYVVGTLLSSLWFVSSYLEHGLEFFNYFFLRENIGKFQSKSYPVTSVLQGLVLYSLPLTILVIPTWKKIKNNFFRDDKTFFLLINFCFFYFIWFLPKQKSHHYAVPAIPILLITLSYYFFSLREEIQKKWIKYLNRFMSIFIVLGALVFVLAFTIDSSLLFKLHYLYFAGILFVLALWFNQKFFHSPSLKILRLVLPLILLWSFIVPIFYLPVMPNHVLKAITQRPPLNFYADFRKPFFVEQAIGQKVIKVDLNHPQLSLDNDSLLMAPSTKIERLSPKRIKKLATWSIWRRGLKLPEILHTALSGDVSKLQEEYSLIQVK